MSKPQPVPWKVSIPDEALQDLKQRLNRVRLPDQLEGVGWEYGAELGQMQQLLEYWRNSYSWRKAEAELNAMGNHFKVALPEYEVELHYVHVKPSSRSPAKPVVPLLLLHGWPGSFFEFKKLIPLLMAPGQEVQYELVIPSLPGFGFSSAPQKPGFRLSNVACLMNDLMVNVLGYERYIVQGGDYGAMIAYRMAANFPLTCAGLHTNFVLFSPNLAHPLHILQALNAGLPLPKVLISAKEAQGLKDMVQWLKTGQGYSQIQSTKPQSLGYAMTDSPFGLMAWIVEKFHSWSDCGKDVIAYYGADDLLTNVCIYWLSGNITSSFRYYKENLSPDGSRDEIQASLTKYNKKVPLGVSIFPKEIIRMPRAWVAHRTKLVMWSEHEAGGHFAALEQPEALAKDISAFVSVLRTRFPQRLNPAAAKDSGSGGGAGTAAVLAATAVVLAGAAAAAMMVLRK